MATKRKGTYRNAAGQEAVVWFYSDDSAWIEVGGGGFIVENTDSPLETVDGILAKKGYTLVELEKEAPSFDDLKRLCLPGAKGTDTEFLWAAWSQARELSMSPGELLSAVPEMTLRPLKAAARNLAADLDEDAPGIVVGTQLAPEFTDSPGFIPAEFIRGLAGK
ncbi:hypothetical protein [Luteolibacter sp. LG18]|uniref:hypothetical protein n=1 Tax=Luteolibacter sp. LG18 TaxID=2819286 RepID=UPI002B290FD0|nr:hypothetical protein llg_26010 [Luteolibacter sp. LG18]